MSHLTGERVALEGSERRALVIVPPPRIAGLDLHLRDAQGDAREATVYADGVAVGSLPGILEVPLCTREFVIQTPEGETWRGALELEEGEILSRRLELADRQLESALLPTVTQLTSSAEAESPASFDRSAPPGPAAARSAPLADSGGARRGPSPPTGRPARGDEERPQQAAARAAKGS